MNTEGLHGGSHEIHPLQFTVKYKQLDYDARPALLMVVSQVM